MARPETFAIATPSYVGDLERCRLLCASIDRFVTGHGMHYLLVEDADAQLFRPLAGPRRRIVAESDLLPAWLRGRPNPFSLRRRRVWTSLGALARGIPPLRGWHAQQLRKLALPSRIDEEVVLFADSDVIFLKPFDVARLAGGDGTRLFRAPGAITSAMAEHVGWQNSTSAMLDLPMPPLPAADYVTHLATWRRANVEALLRHLERVSGRDWISAVARHRRFSEYMIYGRFVTEVLSPEAAGHVLVERDLAHSFWRTEDIAGQGLDDLAAKLRPDQVAIGVQSLLGEPIDRLRRIFEQFDRAPLPLGA